MKQSQYSPLTNSLMAVSLFAVKKRFYVAVDVKRVLAFEAGLHGYLKTKQAALLSKIEETKQLDKDGEAVLAAAVADFKKAF